MNKTVSKSKLNQHLNHLKMKMFADRDSLASATDYAYELLQGGNNQGDITVALMVYHNTLISEIEKNLVNLQEDSIEVPDNLLKALKTALNVIPNTPLSDPNFKDTYSLASSLSRLT